MQQLNPHQQEFDSMSQLLRQQPKELKHHAQRITLACKMRQSEYVFGALLDLYVAFKDLQPFKESALNLARPHLKVEQYLYLQLHSNQPFDLSGYLPNCPQAVLLTDIAERLAITPSYHDKKKSNSTTNPLKISAN